MKCLSCGRHITPRSNFCPYCGKPAAPRRNKIDTQKTTPRWLFYLVLVVASIAIGVLSFRWLQEKETTTTTTTASAPVTATDFDPTQRGEQLAQLYPAVNEVASQFNCPCGDCNDGVEVCDCQMERGAAEVRSFIHQLLQIHKPPHVIELVAEKYGHRKDGLPESLNSEKLMPPSSSVPSKPEAAINNK